MTTIAYTGNALHGDTRWVTSLIPAPFIGGKPKIHVSPNGHFAYGIAGAPPVSGHEKYLTDTMRLLMMFDTVRVLDRGPISEFHEITNNQFQSCLKHTQIVMSKTFGYVVTSLGKGDLLFPIFPGDLAAIGAGWDIFLGAYEVTRDPQKAYDATASLDYLSSNDVVTILQKDLTPMPKPKHKV